MSKLQRSMITTWPILWHYPRPQQGLHTNILFKYVTLGSKRSKDIGKICLKFAHKVGTVGNDWWVLGYDQKETSLHIWLPWCLIGILVNNNKWHTHTDDLYPSLRVPLRLISRVGATWINCKVFIFWDSGFDNCGFDPHPNKELAMSEG